MTVRDRVSFDRIAHRYDETRTLPPSQMEPIMEVLVEALFSYERVLEIGVGTGRFAIPLQRRAIPLIGVDISSRMVARGREKGLRDVLYADALNLPFRDRSFDAVLSIHVLHLLPDWRAALAEFGRVSHGSYLTVATTWADGRSPYRAYWDHLREAGYDRPRRGVFERNLPDHLPPRERTPIGTFVEKRQTRDSLDGMKNRIYSGQWEIPEDLHQEAVRAAREAFTEDAMRLEKTIELLRWDAEDLREDWASPPRP